MIILTANLCQLLAQKQSISNLVQAILKETACDELPNGEINFILHVDGAENWSWANIRNNSTRDVEVPDILIDNISVR